MRYIVIAVLFWIPVASIADPYDYSNGTCVVTNTSLGRDYLQPTTHSYNDCRSVGWWLLAHHELENIDQQPDRTLDQETINYVLLGIASILLLGFMFRLARRVMNI